MEMAKDSDCSYQAVQLWKVSVHVHVGTCNLGNMHCVLQVCTICR